MTIQYRGGARLPGPLGIGSWDSSLPVPGARLPGPIGNQLWDKNSVTPSQTPSTKAAKTTMMPVPTKGLTGEAPDKDVHAITLPLFNGSEPRLEDVQQAPGIANCPVAAMLAAFAFTPTGRTFLQRILGETAATVATDVSRAKGTDIKGRAVDILSNPPPKYQLTSARFFTVKVADGPFEVSDVLYTNDSDSNWGVYYLRDPAGKCIWASVIEKALAVRLDYSYENFDARNLSANDFWKMLTSFAPAVITIDDKTTLAEISDRADASTRIPTVAASKDETSLVTPFHGFAMMGRIGPKIQLYDPAKAKPFLITPIDFRKAFKNILYRK